MAQTRDQGMPSVKIDDRKRQRRLEHQTPLGLMVKTEHFLSQELNWCVRFILLWAVLGVLVTPAFPQSSDGDKADAASSDPAKPWRRVNPLTGQISASAADYVPLTGSERVKMYFKQNYWAVGAYMGPFAAALVLDQARGDPREWGGGFPGYGRRLTSRVAGAVIQGSFQAPVAALLKEDTRYIVSNQHGFKRRAGHALRYGFLTYNNQGHPTLNIANLGGYYAASAASTLWLPGTRNAALYALTDGSQQIGLNASVNLIQEFWPEIRHKVFRRP